MGAQTAQYFAKTIAPSADRGCVFEMSVPGGGPLKHCKHEDTVSHQISVNGTAASFVHSVVSLQPLHSHL